MSVKESTKEELYKYYKSNNKNISRVVKVSKAILLSKRSTPIIRGEVCEALLVLMLTDYIRKNNLKEEGWFISKGLILK
ncbi:MAG: hypothetical protein ACRC5M_05450, partial [Anaeroplasmataceae bacterium]